MIVGSEQLPRARTEGLLIEELPDEVLVYDLDRKKAHCLNQTAALIWKHCDGNNSVDEITLILQRQSKENVSSEVVWYGLDRLQKANLIERTKIRAADGTRLTRRQLVKIVGLAVSVPLVTSILAPNASAALSCVGKNCVGQPGACGLCTCNGTVCV